MTKQINGKPVEVIQSHSWRGILDKLFKLQRDGYTVYESLSGHNSKSGTIIKLTMMKDQYGGVDGVLTTALEQTTDQIDNPIDLGEPIGTVETENGVGFVFNATEEDTSASTLEATATSDEGSSIDQPSEEAKPATKRGRKKAE